MLVTHPPLPAIHLLPTIAVPRLLLLFQLDCACGGGARGGGRLVRGRVIGKVSLSEVVLVLLAVEAGAVKEGSGFLLLRLGRPVFAPYPAGRPHLPKTSMSAQVMENA
jgi:hypothetical protein